MQYVAEQSEYPEIWRAFLRRIVHVWEMTEDGVIEHPINDFLPKGQELSKKEEQYSESRLVLADKSNEERRNTNDK